MEGNVGKRRHEGTPPPGTVWCVSGAPRGGSHCDFRLDLGCGVCPTRPLQPASRLVQGFMQRPPRPTRPSRPLGPSSDPGRGLGAGARESGERGSPGAFSGWATPSRNLLGKAGGRPQRIGFDITARSRPSSQLLCPCCSPSESLRKPGWLLLLFCLQLFRIPGEARVGDCPRRWPWMEPQVRPRSDIWRQRPFPTWVGNGSL